jgi:hypothetical protein
MTTPPDRLRLLSGTLKPLAAYVPSLYQRWNAGCRNAAQIHRELQDQHMAVSVRTVSRWRTILRAENGSAGTWAAVAPTRRPSTVRTCRLRLRSHLDKARACWPQPLTSSRYGNGIT